MVFDFNFSGFAGNAFGPDVRLLNVFLAAWDPRGRLVRWVDALVAVWKAWLCLGLRLTRLVAWLLQICRIRRCDDRPARLRARGIGCDRFGWRQLRRF